MQKDFTEVFRLEFGNAADYYEARKSIEDRCSELGLTRLRIDFNDAATSISFGETYWYRRYLRPNALEDREHPLFRYHSADPLLFYQNVHNLLHNAPYNVVLNKQAFFEERLQSLMFMQSLGVPPKTTRVQERKMSDIITEFKKYGGVIPLSEYHTEPLSKRFMIEAMPTLREVGGVIVGEFFTQAEQDLLDDYILNGADISPDLEMHLRHHDAQFGKQGPYNWRGVIEAARAHKVRFIGTETPFSEHAYYLHLAISGKTEPPKQMDRGAMFDRLIMQNAHAIRMVQDQVKHGPVIVHGGAFHMFDSLNDETQQVYPGIASAFGREPVHTSERVNLPFGHRNSFTMCKP